MSEEIKNEEIRERESIDITVGDEVEERVESIDGLRESLKMAEDKYLRVHADFENTKKRLEREKYQLLDYAYEKFAKDLLPVIDSLDMALASSNNENADKAELLEKLKEGISLTMDNFIKVFKNHGVEIVGTNEGFDPHLHEAIMQTPSEAHDEGAIVAVLQKGYKYKERVLRPALVNVCKK